MASTELSPGAFSGPFGGQAEDRLEEILRDIRIKAETLPPDQFLAMMDRLVESSRRYIAACEDEAVRTDLRQMYQGIVKYALDCQMRTRSVH